MNRQRVRRLTLALAGACILTACGKDLSLKPHGHHDSANDDEAQDAAAAAAGDATADDVSRLEVLAPGELARKIYDAFGAGMTTVTQGGKSYDYIDANAANFVGSISNDPNNKYASQFSRGYFLALAGLSDIVGQNYAAAVYSQRAVHDCRTTDGAEALLRAVAPTMTDDEAKQFGADLVAACLVDPAAAASATVQSYSTALKATF